MVGLVVVLSSWLRWKPFHVIPHSIRASRRRDAAARGEVEFLTRARRTLTRKGGEEETRREMKREEERRREKRRDDKRR